MPPSRYAQQQTQVAAEVRDVDSSFTGDGETELQWIGGVGWEETALGDDFKTWLLHPGAVVDEGRSDERVEMFLDVRFKGGVRWKGGAPVHPDVTVVLVHWNRDHQLRSVTSESLFSIDDGRTELTRCSLCCDYGVGTLEPDDKTSSGGTSVPWQTSVDDPVVTCVLRCEKESSDY